MLRSILLTLGYGMAGALSLLLAAGRPAPPGDRARADSPSAEPSAMPTACEGGRAEAQAGRDLAQAIAALGAAATAAPTRPSPLGEIEIPELAKLLDRTPGGGRVRQELNRLLGARVSQHCARPGRARGQPETLLAFTFDLTITSVRASASNPRFSVTRGAPLVPGAASCLAEALIDPLSIQSEAGAPDFPPYDGPLTMLLSLGARPRQP
jgi:hypothetical protein